MESPFDFETEFSKLIAMTKQRRKAVGSKGDQYIIKEVYFKFPSDDLNGSIFTINDSEFQIDLIDSCNQRYLYKAILNKELVISYGVYSGKLESENGKQFNIHLDFKYDTDYRHVTDYFPTYKNSENIFTVSNSHSYNYESPSDYDYSGSGECLFYSFEFHLIKLVDDV